MSVPTLESRIESLEQMILSLQNQINWINQKTGVPAVFVQQDFTKCSCTSSQCYQMNGAWICATCNKPLANLPTFTASGSAGQTGT